MHVRGIVLFYAILLSVHGMYYMLLSIPMCDIFSGYNNSLLG